VWGGAQAGVGGVDTASERASASGVPGSLERIDVGTQVKGMASVAGQHRATA
jgi:hypothetical protein